MRSDGAPADVCIRDISARGLMVQSAEAPERGAFVEIVAAHRTIIGRVVWRKERRFGLRTRDRLDVLAIIGRLPLAAARESAPREGRMPARPPVARPAVALNRALGSAMELAVIALFAAMLVAALASTAYQILSQPLSRIVVQM
jgi:hypothetical protein